MAKIERKVYKVEEDLKLYMHPLARWNKQLPLPNLEEITDPLQALRALSYHNQFVKYFNESFKLPPQYKNDSGYPTYCHLFLMANVHGTNWDGTGLLLTSHNADLGRVFHFALCKHEKTEEGHNPNHGRGWHPGHCKHCNMDMTVDSGD